MTTADSIRSLPPLPSSPGDLRGRDVWPMLLRVNVAGLFALACFYRLWQLDHLPGINGDEAWYGIQAMKLLDGEPIAWRTPTNNLLNLLYFLPLLAAHAIGEPSAALLRVPAVLSGLLALPVNYLLCRNLFGSRTALTTTLLLAVLPLNIAYSRFGWDASQTLLATLPVVYLPLLALRSEAHRSRWFIGAAVAYAAALWVHPTNIFTAPLIAAPLVWLGRAELLAWWRMRRPASHWIAWAAGSIAVLTGIGWLARRWVMTVFERLLTPSQLGEFAANFERLLSGTAVYRYIAGSQDASQHSLVGGLDLLPVDLALWLLLAGCLAAAWQLARRDATGLDRSLLAGWGLCLLGFFLIAGPGAIAPHYERYGLCLIAPSVLLLARGMDWWLARPRPIGRVAAMSGLALAWLTLAGFQRHYFEFVQHTGGQSHATFRTAQIEPKQAALDYIVRESPASGTVWIVTLEYWNDKPLSYLAAGRPNVRVCDWATARQSPDYAEAIRAGRVWFVEFTNSASHWAIREQLRVEQIAVEETIIRDYAGQPVLSVLGRQRQAAQDLLAGSR